MAVPYKMASILADGLDARGPYQKSSALNLYRRNGAWYVRRGFGQVAQFDCAMSAPLHPDGDYTTEWGYKAHLGSEVVETSFGHTQVVSVFVASVYTTEAFLTDLTPPVDDTSRPTHQDLYVVRIYDVDDDTTWEVPLYRHTADIASGDEYLIHGCYETAQADDNKVYDFQSFFHAATPDVFWFSLYRGSLFFGNPEVGAHVYVPASFRKRPETQVRNWEHKAYGSQRGESAIVKPVSMVDGFFSDGFVYLQRGETPNPSLAFGSDALGRMIYVTDRTLYVSDVGSPASVQAGNALQLLTTSPITAVRELQGSIYIFTKTKTFVWQPSRGTNLVVPGRLITLSDTVGCDSQALTVVADQQLVWADRNGMYSTNGSLAIAPISDPVDNFWTSKLTRPITSYYAENGGASGEVDGVKDQYHYSADKAHLRYFARLGLFLLVQPGQRMALVHGDGQWSIWSFESSVSMHVYSATGNPPATPRAGATRNIGDPWIVATADRLWVAGSIDVQTVTATTAHGWSSLQSRSAYLLEYGVGGGLDRNVADEDGRTVAGWFDVSKTNEDWARFYIGKPIPLEDGYAYQNSPDQTTNPPGPDGINYQDYLVPVTFVPEKHHIAAMPFTGFDLELTFDNAHWAPVLRTLDPVKYSTTDTELALVFPPERVTSIEGYSMGIGSTPSAITGREAQVYQAGVPQVGGDTLRISFNGAALAVPAGSWGAQPALALTEYQHNVLFYIPMRRLRAADGSQDVTSMLDWTVTNTALYNGAHNLLGVNPGAGVWRQSHLFKSASVPFVVAGQEATGPRRMDNVAQPVDWAYQSSQVGLENASKLKLRGVRTELRSTGAGRGNDSGNQGWATWTDGLLNYLFGSDRKEKQSQLLDYQATPSAVDRIADKEGIRTRVYDASQALATNTYGESVTWGDPADPTVGNSLVADDEFSTVVASGNARGATVSVTLYGRIFSRATQIALQSSKAMLRVLGYSGRKGRSR